jgi:hypothetical protein
LKRLAVNSAGRFLLCPHGEKYIYLERVLRQLLTSISENLDLDLQKECQPGATYGIVRFAMRRAPRKGITMRYIKYLVLLSALTVLPAAYSQAQVINEGFHSFNGPDRFRESGFRTFGSERAVSEDNRGYRGGDSYPGGGSYSGSSHGGSSYNGGSSYYGNGGGKSYSGGGSHYGGGSYNSGGSYGRGR